METIVINIVEQVDNVSVNVTEQLERITVHVSNLKGDKGDKGEDISLRIDGGYIQSRLGTGSWNNLIALTELKGSDGLDGQNGLNAELRVDSGYIQTRVGSGTWSNLISLDSIKGNPGSDGLTPVKGVDYFDGSDGDNGKEVELQNTGTYIQWRYTGEAWNNLVTVASLKGDKGDTGNNGITPVKGVDYFDGADGQDGSDGLPVELQKTATHIQWRLQGGEWANIVSLSELEGPAGSDATVTKAAVEAVLTGAITTHGHTVGISDVTGLQTALNAKADILSRSSCFTIESDFFSSNVSAACPGLLGAAISSGTSAVVTSVANHPGVLYLRDSTTANGGFRYMTEITSFLIAGGEKAVFVFQIRGARSTASSRLGWQDSTAIQTAPTDGIWFEVTGDGTNATLVGRCKNNAGPSTTADPYQLTLNTWYTGVIEVNSNASLVTFTLYAENGTQLWQKTVNANIPTASGRETGFGIIAGETTTDAAADILWIDYLRMEINRTLTR